MVDDYWGEYNPNSLRVIQMFIKWRARGRCERCRCRIDPGTKEGVHHIPWKSRGPDPGTKGEVHHIRWRSHGGTDRPENLIFLCVRCHKSMHRNRKNRT